MSSPYSSNPMRTVRRHVIDPNPEVITDEERAYIFERLSAGAAPRQALIRKLVRLCDKRQEQIRRLEDAAARLIAWSE